MRPRRSAERRRVALIGQNVVQATDDPFNATLLRYAQRSGRWDFVLVAEATERAVAFLRHIACDGALARILTPGMAREARRARIPVVNFSSWLDLPGVPTVRRDDHALGALCARHLLRNGFARFGVVSVPGGWFIDERCRGFTETVRRAEPGARIAIHTVPSFPLTAGARAAFQRFVRALEPPAALFLADDIEAAGLLHLCRGAGRSIPRDLAVVAGAGHARWLDECRPELSHAMENTERIAWRAAEYLDALMDGKAPAPEPVVVAPSGLAIRASSDTLAIEDPEVARAVDFMQRNVSERINVSDIAARAHVARVTLERRFRAAVGTSLHDHLVRLRVERARRLLRDPERSLTSIARGCGFPSLKRFNAAFATATGARPAEWRARGA